MIILGAGLAGCIAAHLFPGSRILEAGSKDSVGQHRAVLRFRSDAISRITGIPFRKVKVYKAVVWGENQYLSEVPLWLLNAYSQKVAGKILERSITNLAPVERWVAPDDLHSQLVARLPVEFDQAVAFVTPTCLWMDTKMSAGVDRTDEPVLSTMPLSAMLQATRFRANAGAILNFDRAPIFVTRYRLTGCDVFQTCYFPAQHLNVYRASITGNLLIMECVRAAATLNDEEAVFSAFGLKGEQVETCYPPTRQNYGKIVPLNDAVRRALLLRLTREFGVYSFGRFATWRNLLLDDLPPDAEKIRALMRMSDYEHTLVAAL